MLDTFTRLNAQLGADCASIIEPFRITVDCLPTEMHCR
jgi:hypothetical protein